MTEKIVVNLPDFEDKSQPDFMLIMYKVSHFQEVMSSGKWDSAAIKEIIDFLFQFLADKERWVDDYWNNPLWHASQEQFTEILSALGGSDKQIPPQNSEPTATP